MVKALKNESISRKIFVICNFIFMILLIVVTLYPMIYVLFASLSESNLLMAHRGVLLRPEGFSTAAYRAVFKNPLIMTGYRNTLFIVVVGVALNMLMTIVGGYALSRRDVYWLPLINGLIVFTMYFSGGMIPFYFAVRRLHLDNTIWALIIPSALSTYNMIIMRTAFVQIPESLEESAMLDGANDFVILFRIMLPLVVPTLAVLVLYYAVGHWNSWFNAMIFIRDRKLYPLQLVLREVLVQNDASAMMEGIDFGARDSVAATIKYSTIVVATLPILVLYPFLQKFFEKGVMVGALKG